MATLRNSWRYFVPPVVSILIALIPAPTGLEAHSLGSISPYLWELSLGLSSNRFPAR